MLVEEMPTYLLGSPSDDKTGTARYRGQHWMSLHLQVSLGEALGD